MWSQGKVWIVEDDGPNDCGAARIFDLEPDGAIDSQSELSDLAATLPSALAQGDNFGAALASLGDLDGNGTPDLAVGAPGDDGGGTDRGAVWLLFRAADGSVLSALPLRPGVEFPGAAVPASARFGSSLAMLGDLDGDGSVELAVGAAESSTTGSVWMLSLEPDGDVSRELRISEASEGFGGDLDIGDEFGRALAALGDFDANGVNDLVVGARSDDDGVGNAGAIWLLLLESDGTVGAEHKISRTAGDFAGVLAGADRFGSAVAVLGDLDGDGVTDLAVGTPGSDDGSSNAGAVWVLFLNADGTVSFEQKLSRTAGGLGTHSDLAFGSALAPLGDLNSDGEPDLGVGAPSAIGNPGPGALYVLFLNADGSVLSRRRLSAEFSLAVTSDNLGSGLAFLGDWDLDGRPDVAVGATLREGAPTDGDFRHLHTAIASADAGDAILIRDGSYSSYDAVDGIVIVDSKSLTLQAANPLGAIVDGSLRIQNLAPGESVQLSGLVFERNLPVTTLDDTPLRLENNAGKVWIDDCNIPTGTGFFSAHSAGLRVEDCSTVLLNRCELGGSSGLISSEFEWGDPAPPGLLMSGDSGVHAYDCVFTGADGVENMCGVPVPVSCAQDGGAGITSLGNGDFLFLSGCTVQGGSGAYNGACSKGGDGLQMAGVAKVLDSTLAGGPGGHNGVSQCAPSGASQTGTVHTLSGTHLGLSVLTPAPSNDDTPFSFEGPPGAAVFVHYSLTSAAQFRPTLGGTDMLGPVRTMTFIGRIGPGGTLATDEVLGLLPPGLDFVKLFAQSLYLAPSTANFPNKARALDSRVQLGTGAAIVILDPAFF